MNKLQDFANVFDGIKPWAGKVPKGYLVDFLGILTDAKFRKMFGVDPATTGGDYVETRLPTIEDGEGWFEAANWMLAARAARGRYVMVTLRRLLRSAGGRQLPRAAAFESNAVQARCRRAGARQLRVDAAPHAGQRHRSRRPVACEIGDQRAQRSCSFSDRVARIRRAKLRCDKRRRARARFMPTRSLPPDTRPTSCAI